MNRLREKTTATLLIAIFMISTFAVAMTVSADSVDLLASGGAGAEDSIVIEMPVGFKLRDLYTISWEVWTRTGYPPHVDIILGTDIDGIPDNIDSLTAEIGENDNPNDREWLNDLEDEYTYNEWLKTFEYSVDDGDSVVDDDTILWVTRHGAGCNNAPYGTLAELKAGEVTYPLGQNQPVEISIGGHVLVLRLEFEVDSWLMRDGEGVDSNAAIDNIRINSQPGVSVTGYARPPTTSISVSPTDINFGEIVLGQIKDVDDVTITNTGDTNVDLTAELEDDDGFYAASLRLDGATVSNFANTVPTVRTVNLRLDVDRYAEAGVHTAVLVFVATPPSP